MDINLDAHPRGHVEAPHSPQSGGGVGSSRARQDSASTSNTSGSYSANGAPSSQQCSAGSKDSTCLALADAEASSSSPSTGEAIAKSRAGFSLKGFLRVEVVGLEAAEVTFRPGEERRAALIREREEAAHAEKEVRKRGKHLIIVVRLSHCSSRPLMTYPYNAEAEHNHSGFQRPGIGGD